MFVEIAVEQNMWTVFGPWCTTTKSVSTRNPSLPNLTHKPNFSFVIFWQDDICLESLSQKKDAQAGGQTLKRTCLVFMKYAGSIDVKIAEWRVASSKVSKLIFREWNAYTAPVLVLLGEVARSAPHIHVPSLYHAVRQSIVDLVATPVECWLHAVADQCLSPEPFDHLQSHQSIFNFTSLSTFLLCTVYVFWWWATLKNAKKSEKLRSRISVQFIITVIIKTV